MSLIALGWAWGQTLTVHQKMALLVLADCCNGQTSQCNPKREYIQIRSGMGKDALGKSLRDLVRIGLISRSKEFGKGFSYSLHFDVKIIAKLDGRSANSPKVRTVVLQTAEIGNSPKDRTVAHQQSERSDINSPKDRTVNSPKDRTVPLYRTGIEPEVEPEPEKVNDLFDEFWSIWPKRVAKDAARKAWRKVKDKQSTLELINENLRLRQAAGQWTVAKYIPNPASYINGRQWEDVVYEERASSASRSVEDICSGDFRAG